MNVTGAWELGYTGKGVVVTILDDGIEADHPDLIDNYWKQASYDRNDNDFDPTPRYNPTNENRYVTYRMDDASMGFLSLLTRWRAYQALNAILPQRYL